MAFVKDKPGIIVVAICSSILIINLLLLVYVFTQRAYPPLKSRNLPIMYALFMCMVCWFVGSLYVNHSWQVPKSWLICVATFSWARMSLGIYLFFALFQLRVYLYISIFNWKRRAKGVYLWVPIGYHVAVPLAYAIVAAALPQSLGYGYSPDTYTCMNHDAIYYIGIGLTAFQFLISAGLTFKARKINTCFNEFREFVIILAIAMVAGVLSICTRMMSGWQDRSYTVDALDTAAEFIPAQAYFFVVLGPPIYHSIVDKDEYLAYFMRKMLKANLVRQYDMSYTGQLTGTNGFGLGSGADSSVTNRVPGHNITEGRHSRFKELSSTHNTESLEQHQDLTLV